MQRPRTLGVFVGFSVAFARPCSVGPLVVQTPGPASAERRGRPR